MERRAFEIKVGDHELSLALGKCAVALFRQQQEVSYVAVDLEDDRILRIFNNPDLAFDMGGYRLVESSGELYRPTSRRDWGNGYEQTFREAFGWNPSIVERETPSDWEIEAWVELNTQDLDEGVK